MRLLIVDDNHDDRKLLRFTLQRHGFETVYEACNGQEGLEIARSNQPDLIISDALMPGMDGFQFLRMVKMDAELRRIPFIFYSAVYTGYKEEELALTLGAETFIVKPKAPDELWKCIAAVLEKLAAGKEARHHAEPMEEEKHFLKKYDEIVTAKLEEKVRELEDALTRLRETEGALKKSNEELEVRVAERTRELEEKRAELSVQNLELLKTTAERVQAMEKLREKDQILIQQCRMSAMGEMLSNIAHHWRQPLNIIGLKLQELTHFSDVSKELLAANIDQSLKMIFQLSRSIDDFRMFSAPDSVKSWFEVDEIVAKAVSFVEDSFKDRQIVIELSTAGHLQVNSYPNELGQAVLNILMHARQTLLQRATQDARVTLRTWKENGRIEVTITHNAGGIEQEMIDKVFDPHLTSRDQGAYGVGLFMSKTIVESKMGGRLTARNVEGGAEFRIEL